MRKYILLFLVTFSTVKMLSACSCYVPPAFCVYTNFVLNNPDSLIFVGQRVETDTINESLFAYKYRVESVIRGAVVPGPTQLFYDGTYENTDSTVWVLGGDSSQCFRVMADRALLAMNYIDEHGYVPTLCRNDYFTIDDDGYITGPLVDSLISSTIHISDIDDLIDGNCTTSVIDPDEKLAGGFLVMPTVFQDRIMVESSDPIGARNIQYQISDYTGHIIKHGNLFHEKTMLSLVDIPPGIYFVILYIEGKRQALKIVKSDIF